MRVISRARLVHFWEEHPDAESPLETWRQIVRRANWKTFADLRASFGNADLVGNCVVFNIGRNKYRLIAAIHYQKLKKDASRSTGRVYVRNVLTHGEYDRGQWKRDCGAE